MYKKDLIEREIDKFAEMMAILLLGKENENNAKVFESQLEDALKDCVEMPIDDFLAIADNDLLKSLLTNKSYSVEKIDYLAELLFLYAEELQQKGNRPLAAKAFGKMQTLWNYSTQHQKTISFDRITKNEKRKLALQDLELMKLDKANDRPNVATGMGSSTP